MIFQWVAILKAKGKTVTLPPVAVYFKYLTIFVTAIVTLVIPSLEVLLVPPEIYKYGATNATMYVTRSTIVGFIGFVFTVGSSLYGHKLYRALKGI